MQLTIATRFECISHMISLPCCKTMRNPWPQKTISSHILSTSTTVWKIKKEHVMTHFLSVLSTPLLKKTESLVASPVQVRDEIKEQSTSYKFACITKSPQTPRIAEQKLNRKHILEIIHHTKEASLPDRETSRPSLSTYTNDGPHELHTSKLCHSVDSMEGSSVNVIQSRNHSSNCRDVTESISN